MKEDAFIQPGTRGGDRQPGRRRLMARLQLEGKAVAGKPREVVDCRLGADKPGGTTGEQDRPLNLGFQSGEIKPQTSE